VTLASADATSPLSCMWRDQDSWIRWTFSPSVIHFSFPFQDSAGINTSIRAASIRRPGQTMGETAAAGASPSVGLRKAATRLRRSRSQPIVRGAGSFS
jgi:hypothetical protein